MLHVHDDDCGLRLRREDFDNREEWLRHRRDAGDWPVDEDDPDFIGMMSLAPAERS